MRQLTRLWWPDPSITVRTTGHWFPFPKVSFSSFSHTFDCLTVALNISHKAFLEELKPGYIWKKKNVYIYLNNETSISLQGTQIVNFFLIHVLTKVSNSKMCRMSIFINILIVFHRSSSLLRGISSSNGNSIS